MKTTKNVRFQQDPVVHYSDPSFQRECTERTWKTTTTKTHETSQAMWQEIPGKLIQLFNTTTMVPMRILPLCVSRRIEVFCSSSMKGESIPGIIFVAGTVQPRASHRTDVPRVNRWALILIWVSCTIFFGPWTPRDTVTYGRASLISTVSPDALSHLL